MAASRTAMRSPARRQEADVMDSRPAEPASDDISRAEFLPFLLNFADLRRRVFLWPAITTALFCLALLTTTNSEKQFYWICGGYISILNLYLIYLACGKKLPFLYVLSIAVISFVLDVLLMPAIAAVEAVLPSLLAPGLAEETVKAMPLVLVLGMTQPLSRARRRKFGLREPLDGILLAAASATGFAFAETMLIYAPKLGELSIVPRLLDNVFGHIAFAGALGYFIGLAMLKHRHARKVAAAIVIGFVVANALHDLWDTIRFYSGGLQVIGPLHFLIVAVLSFIVLASMLVRARELSPEREFLWPVGATPPYRAPFVEPLPTVPRHRLSPADEISLAIGAERIPLAAGTRLSSRDIPGLKARSAGEIVAEVRPDPAAPGELVLANLSAALWETVLPDGAVRHVGPAQTVPLVNDIRIDFGAHSGTVLVLTPEPERVQEPAVEWC
jgi:RsiW-degrading membrane proteinase PrsW (M82 family)